VSDNTTKERNQLRICCSSGKVIISPMWLLDSMVCCNRSVVCDTSGLLHMSPLKELLNGCKIWCPLNPGLWTEMANPIRIMVISVLCYLSADMWLNTSLIRYATRVKLVAHIVMGFCFHLTTTIIGDMLLTKNKLWRQSKIRVASITHLHHTCLDISTNNISVQNSIHILMIAQEKFFQPISPSL
jgi:hypothetical protein